MTPEAAQDLQAYFGMELFDDDDDEEQDQDFDMKESTLRKIVREEIIKEYGTDADPGRATAASPGGPGTEWEYIARMMYDLKHDRPEIEDIGQKTVNGETVHEFAVQNEVFQIRKVR